MKDEKKSKSSTENNIRTWKNPEVRKRRIEGIRGCHKIYKYEGFDPKKYYEIKVLPLILEKHSLSYISRTKLLNISGPTLTKLVKLYATDEIKNIVKNNSISGKTKFNIKVTEEIVQKILELSKKGRGQDSIAKLLNLDTTTIRNCLLKHLTKEEYELRHSKKKYDTYWSGRYFKNDRGDILQSSLEEKVVDYLFENNIEYVTCKCILGNGYKMFADVYLVEKDIYIEIFGLSDMEFYKTKMVEKIKRYNNLKLTLVSLYSEDFKNDNYKNKLWKIIH